MSKIIFHSSLDLSDTYIKKVQQNKYKIPTYKSYHHITNLGIWSYIDGKLVLTPFNKEVLNVEKNYN